MNINQPVVIIKDKRNPLDYMPSKEKNKSMRIGYYEGLFQWGVRFHNGREWTPGIWDWGEFESGELVTINDVPLNTMYTTNCEQDKPFACPVFRNRFVCGSSKLWEHEIDYQLINRG